MSIRNKIFLYFYILFVFLVSIIFYVIFSLFSNYRQEEFYERLKLRSNIEFMQSELDSNFNFNLDLKNIIKQLPNEHIYIFNNKYQLLSPDVKLTDNEILKLVKRLNKNENVYFGTYQYNELIVRKIIIHNNIYFICAYAYDYFGYTKMNFLRNVLATMLFTITIVMFIIVFILARNFAKPLELLTNEIFSKSNSLELKPISLTSSVKEIDKLTKQFNTLLNFLNQENAFQKNFIQNLSHELKTPISVLISKIERIEDDPENVSQEFLETQKQGLMHISDVISCLVILSKYESSKEVTLTQVWIDDLILDVVKDIKFLNKQFNYELNITTSNLCIEANELLIRILFKNLLENALKYATNAFCKVLIEEANNFLYIRFYNNGANLNKDEQARLFQDFFRGQNATHKSGFGIGLMLGNRIMTIHKGMLKYEVVEGGLNCLTCRFNILKA